MFNSKLDRAFVIEFVRRAVMIKFKDSLFNNLLNRIIGSVKVFYRVIFRLSSMS